MNAKEKGGLSKDISHNGIVTAQMKIWQLLSWTHHLSAARAWKWKWSNGVEKSETDLFWCISMTNNVKSCKKINWRVQTFRFTVDREPQRNLQIYYYNFIIVFFVELRWLWHPFLFHEWWLFLFIGSLCHQVNCFTICLGGSKRNPWPPRTSGFRRSEMVSNSVDQPR